MSIIPSTILTLTEYAEQVRDAAADALAATSEGTPADVYIESGDRPAYDCCPALIVYVDAINEAPTSPFTPTEASALRGKLGAITLATYVVTVLRCAPAMGVNGTSPSSSDKELVADQTLQDAWALWNGLRNAWRDGEIFELCTGVHWDGLRPVSDQGGCVGWTMTIRAMIPGIPNG